MAILPHLPQLGVELDCVALDEPCPAPGSQRQMAATVRAAVQQLASGIEAGWRMRRPDLVHVELAGNLGRAVAAAAQRSGLPVTATWHRLDATAPAGQADRVHDLMLAFHRCCVGTLVHTRGEAVRLRALGMPGIAVVPLGVDSDAFTPDRRDPGLRSTWGAGPDDPVLIWVGRAISAKAPDLLAEAATAARAAVPGTRLVVVGDGPDLPRLRAALPWASFLDRLAGPRLCAALASADALVFPSPIETFGLVVVEAMASGLPVVAFDGAAAADYVTNGRSGTLVRPGPQGRADFVAAVVGLARNRASLPAMGRCARDAVRPLTWEAAAAGYAGFWRSFTPRG